MARFEIKIDGFDKRGQKRGSATRVLRSSRTMLEIAQEIVSLRGQVKVGQCGRHVVRVTDAAGKTFERIDQARRGATPAQDGVFKEVAMKL